MICILIFSSLIVLLLIQNMVMPIEVVVERFETIPGKKETLITYAGWKVARFKKLILVSGNITLHVDIDDSFTRHIEFEYSSKGNNYMKFPWKLPKEGICHFYNTTYKKYLQSFHVGHSNFPVIPPEGLCPIPKGKYWVENATMDLGIPPGTPKGFYKATMLSSRNDEVIGGLLGFARLI